jgi:hypothetical protein
MDLGYPYTDQEIAERATRFKELSRRLMCYKPDVKYNFTSSTDNNYSYTVEYISKRNTKRVNRLKQYLVKWENYDEPTWQFEYVLIQDLGKEVFTRLLS